MFSQLNVCLDLDDKGTLPLDGACIAICDQERQAVPRPQPALHLQLLSTYLRRGHPCCFCSLTETFSHAKIVSAKCGFGIQSFLDSGQLCHISALKLCHELGSSNSTTSENPPGLASGLLQSDTSGSLRHVFRKLQESLMGLREKFVEKPHCLVFEDLSVLLDLGFEVHNVIEFVHSLRSVVADGALIVYTSRFEENEPEATLNRFLFHVADWLLETSGLQSGLSAAVDGQMVVHIRNGENPEAARKTYHYKVQERQIQFFSPGTSTLRM